MTVERRTADQPVAVERRAIPRLQQEVESVITEAELIATCFFCQANNVVGCKLGLSRCPWEQDGALSDAAIQAELTGQACPTDLVLHR